MIERVYTTTKKEVADAIARQKQRVREEKIAAENRRRQMQTLSEKRDYMRMKCRPYIEMPIHKMNAMEEASFATHIARSAGRLLRIKDGSKTRAMTNDEVGDFAAAVNAAIVYFNRRDAAHEAHLRYREECRMALEAAKHREEEKHVLKKDEVAIKIK